MNTINVTPSIGLTILSLNGGFINEKKQQQFQSMIRSSLPEQSTLSTLVSDDFTINKLPTIVRESLVAAKSYISGNKHANTEDSINDALLTRMVTAAEKFLALQSKNSEDMPKGLFADNHNEMVVTKSPK